ncbi:SET and MYND domain-containing protein 4-like isoform X1 [Diorhabda carinulata]|uniref:SET and MYND domain-containing protein 4-like isoform X1 n=1 Tax=Diorhabda carinulata TaxID=1163345 RepID=UPI0025A18224|nr:SET and MYND domain-containing protein 4-like isoform X1 [Diorhabda carinulata]
MDCLLAYYNEKFTKIDGNIFEVFAKFYNLDLTPVHSWLENQFKNKVVKDDGLSLFYRKEGNKCYAQKNLLKSLEFYTKSLCTATPGSREYGLALANRSAVTFEMKEYENCLKDIDLCFNTDYPVDLIPKIYFRKADCYYESGRKDDFDKCIEEIQRFLSITLVDDRDKHLEKLEQIKKSKIKCNNVEVQRDNFNDLPEFSEGENSSFAYASSKIKMGYDKTRGRHVVATKNISKGDVLFVEKAFIFAPVFKENKEFYSFKCYSCLKDIISSVPCASCTLCVYCNEKCRTTSWNECHKWECKGMQANIWYDLGIAFPAFKAVLKGVKSGFRTIKGDFGEDLKKFGDKTDNYPYFNRLVSNIYKGKNAAPYILMAAIVVTYLKKYTDFFVWFLKQKNCPRNDLSVLVQYIGGLITKHIAQLSCNSSIIEHWTYSSTDLLFPDILITIACGMFPSVSIMNHSCRPNVTNFFICDTIVVKALEDIKENEEVFNCYGIDYRGMNREQRQIACRTLYHFECKCLICSDPLKEVEMLDSYLCPKCKGLIPELQNATFGFCLNCGEKYSIKPFRKINNEAQKYLQNDDINQLELLIKCLKIREKILYKHHKDFEEVYYRLYSYYVESGNAENMFKYFHLWLENEKARRGNNSRGIGTKLYEAALAILHCLQNGNPKNCTNLKAFLQNVEHMIREAKMVLNLYYPAYITNRLSRKIQFISNK